MAASFQFREDWGTASGGRGTTNDVAVTDVSWKNTGNPATAHTSAPITATNNSFPRYQYGYFSGAYNQILNLLFSHTAGVADTGITLMGPPACTGDGDKLAYATPSASAVSGLTNITTVIAIGSSTITVCVGPTGPNATGKASSSTAVPCYTNYLTTQLLTSGSAVAGDMTPLTVSLRYDEN